MSDSLQEPEYTTQYWDRSGTPIDLEKWTELFGDTANRQVARYEGKGYIISTVWLGISLDDPDYARPRIFETAVFREGPPALLRWRYPTEANALEGHHILEGLAKRGKLGRELDYRPGTRDESSSSGFATGARVPARKSDPLPARACENCDRLFVPRRTDQRFHSSACRKHWNNVHKPTTRAGRAPQGPSEAV